MSDQTNANDPQETPEIAAIDPHQHEHGPECDHEHEHEDDQPKPITIELEDLTAEGKAKAEEQLHRTIADCPYTLVSQENQPGAVVALTFDVPADAYQAEQSLLLNDLRKEIILPGFRKGKAPVALILKRMGDEAIRDTIGSLATNVLRQEQAKQNWSMLTKPRVGKLSAPGKDGEAARFEIELETTPVVEVKEYQGLTVEVERREVTGEAVDARIEEMRRQNSVQEKAADDHGLADEDLLVADVEVANAAGELLEHLCQKDRTIYEWKRELPHEIAEVILGKKTGETVEAKVSNKTTNRRGEEVIHEDFARVTIKEIRVTKLPAVDDEFAKDLGDYENLAALRKKVLDDLVKAEEDRRRTEGLGKLYRLIIEKNPVDVPRSLIAQEQYQMIMQDSYQMQRYGLRLEQVVQDVNRYLQDQRAGADETVRLQLLMAELRKAVSLDVTDADVDAEIARMAEESGRKPLAVRARLEAQNQIDELRQTVVRKKIGDYLLSQNSISLVEPKPAEAASAESAEVAAEGKDEAPSEEAKPKAKPRARKPKAEKSEAGE